ncbi:MAG: prepilin-type N-terminal cleavage/methylation domain-containing protein [Mycoplasmatota bacterium]
MKKGFTLIELLGVLVIIIVIAAISTPIVTNIINSSRESTDLVSVESIVKGAGELYYNARLDTDKTALTDINEGNNIFEHLEITGTTFESADVRVDEDGKVYMAVYLNGICYTKSVLSDEITSTESATAESCDISLTKYRTTVSYYNAKTCYNQGTCTRYEYTYEPYQYYSTTYCSNYSIPSSSVCSYCMSVVSYAVSCSLVDEYVAKILILETRYTWVQVPIEYDCTTTYDCGTWSTNTVSDWTTTPCTEIDNDSQHVECEISNCDINSAIGECD